MQACINIPMGDTDIVSRRQALKAYCAAGTSCISGCLDFQSGKKSQRPPEYTDWAYSKSVVHENPDHRDYTFRFHNYNNYRDNMDELSNEFKTYLDEELRNFVFISKTRSKLSKIIGINNSTVFVGNWSKKDVKDETTEYINVSKRNSYKKFDIYATENDKLAVGIANGEGIVSKASRNVTSPIDIVKQIIKTKSGEATKYINESSKFDQLVRRSGSGDFVWIKTFPPWQKSHIKTGNIKNTVGKALDYKFVDNRLNGRIIFLFKSSDSVNTGEVKSFLNEWYPSWDDPAISRKGRAVIVTKNNLDPGKL